MGLVTVSTSQHSTPPWLTDCLLYPYHVTHAHTRAPQYTVECYKVLPNSEKPRRRSDGVRSPGITAADRNSQKAEGCLDLWILTGQRSKSALCCLPATQTEGKRPNSKYVVAFPDPVTGCSGTESFRYFLSCKTTKYEQREIHFQTSLKILHKSASCTGVFAHCSWFSMVVRQSLASLSGNTIQMQVVRRR